MTGEEITVVLNSLTLVEVKQLCRKLNVPMGKANKTSLVQRLISYREMGLFEKGRIDNDQLAKKVSYLSDELTEILKRLPAFDSDALSDVWATKLSRMLSSLSYGDIYNSLVEMRCKTDDERQRKSFKSMKGYSFF